MQNGILLSLLKVRNFHLFLYDRNNELERIRSTEIAWLSNLHCILIKTRSLIDTERSIKLATAISISPFEALCLTETWIVANVNDAELYLNNFKKFAMEREPTKTGASNHCGVLFAINKHMPVSKLNIKLQLCCVVAYLFNWKRQFPYALFIILQKSVHTDTQLPVLLF